MPAKSKAQQKFMGMVHALQKGDMKSSDASKDVRDAAKSMKKKEAEKMASTKHKGLPRKVKQEVKEMIRPIVRRHMISEGLLNERTVRISRTVDLDIRSDQRIVMIFGRRGRVTLSYDDAQKMVFQLKKNRVVR